MYHSKVVAAREAQILREPRFAKTFPHGIPTHSRSEVADFTARLIQAYNPAASGLFRTLTPDEEYFLIVVRTRQTFDFHFWAENFCVIDAEGHGVRPLYPLWESQRVILDKIAQMEYARMESGHPDGILLNILKARQLGASTIAEALLAHRLLTRPYVRCLVGSDVEPQAAYLFRMVHRLYDQLPWFLKPERLTFNKDREMTFATGSAVKTAWGKSTRGELQETTGRPKGHIGRGQTPSCIHISELSTWDNPGQLDDALLPSIPISPYTLVIFESTAKGAGNWWHQQWLASEGVDRVGRFENCFIPWGAEPSKYSLPAPAAWIPQRSTQEHATKAEAIWPQYLGRSVCLSRDQLYFYEQTRALFARKGQLAKFREEYCSDPEECFLYSGRSVWTLDQLESIDKHARPLIDVWRVEPAVEIASLRREEQTALPGPRDPRPPPPLAPREPRARTGEDFPVPPGYGFRRVWQPSELASLPDLRASAFAIWEYPRRRGPRRYTLGVDIGDGLGQDYSVIDVIREPTIEEPAEEVAQFVSNRLTPTQIAFIVDAIGRLYVDEDHLEACAAIECNNHGLSVQDTLQLHLGYTHFYVWEVADAASPEKRFTTRIGWLTTQRTRPLLLDKFYEASTALDPISGHADLRLNSPVTRGELRHFLIPETPGATLGDGAAAGGQHDDAIFAAAIGFYVAYRHAGGEAEPIAERRRRRQALHALENGSGARSPDWRNLPVTAEEADHGQDPDSDFTEDAAGLYFDPRCHE